MTPETMQAFHRELCSQLEKVARVRTAVKMYRRIRQGLQEATPDLIGLDRPATKGMALHGTNSFGLKGILDEAKIEASSLGPTGQHGGGVYWWKGVPREGYLQGPMAEGVMTDLSTLPNKKPMMANIYGGHHNVHAVRSGPEDYKLRPKDTAIIDFATRTQNKSIGPVMADARDNRLRKVDSAIFDKAVKDWRGNNMGKPDTTTNADLTSMLKRRSAGQNF